MNKEIYFKAKKEINDEMVKLFEYCYSHDGHEEEYTTSFLKVLCEHLGGLIGLLSIQNGSAEIDIITKLVSKEIKKFTNNFLEFNKTEVEKEAQK